MSGRVKLLPRNATAWQVGLVAGNANSSRLESGVGNCFPGLEFDIRNLERRFFPFMAVDFLDDRMYVSEVNLTAAHAAGLPAADLAVYQAIAADIANPDPQLGWIVDRVSGTFGPFGERNLTTADFNAGRNDIPADVWTAVRLLAEGRPVTLSFQRQPVSNPEVRRELTANRIAYTDTDTGSLAPVFQPGEMTQSLCSPWTHDFRDCGCYYWASNHPDIALPPKAPEAPSGPSNNRAVAWQRTDRGTLQTPSAPASTTAPVEMRYYEINHRWQELGFVLEGREQGPAYIPNNFTAVPFGTIGELVTQLRYAAGVELGVMLEYLSAAYSLNRTAQGGTVSDDVRAAFAEILRIAIGEMKHLRAANDMIRSLADHGLVPGFIPALQVAAELPAGGGATRPLAFRSLTMATLNDFINIERPSFSVDGLYGRILATVRVMAPGPLEAVVQSIMADGTEHFETFSFIKEWLSRHSELQYLLNLREPVTGDVAHAELQTDYQNLLAKLYDAYNTGLPGGAMGIAEARMDMLARPNGIRGRCETLAAAGIRVRFTPPTDPRFAPIAAPRPPVA